MFVTRLFINRKGAVKNEEMMKGRDDEDVWYPAGFVWVQLLSIPWIEQEVILVK